MFTNDYKGKKELVEALSDVYKKMSSNYIYSIELKKYKNKELGRECEFVLLTWNNGGISTADNNMNSLSATARNVARMLDGGVYENLDFYKKIMKSEDWEEELKEKAKETNALNEMFTESFEALDKLKVERINK